MTNFEIFLAIVSIGWGVLCLILFFKIWKMTDDVNRLTFYVSQLTIKICGEVKEPAPTMLQKLQEVPAKEEVEEEPHDHDFKRGDKVYIIATKKKVEVEKYKGNTILCYCGLMAGFKWFDASELTRTL